MIEAKHLCMMMRGVEKQNSIMKTSCLLGTFKEDARTRGEFLALLSQYRPMLLRSANAWSSPLRAAFLSRLVGRGKSRGLWRGERSAIRHWSQLRRLLRLQWRGQSRNGMLVNISEIKARVEEVLHARFDHKFLNEDHPHFGDVAPTAENVARRLFIEVEPLFHDLEARLVACHLVETPERSATVYADGLSEANYWFEFSAARQTMSPI